MSLKKILTLIFPLFFIISISCSDSELSRQLDYADSIIETRPDSVLSLLENIDKSSLMSPKDKARYALLYSMALDKNYVDTTTFDVLQPAIDYYSDNGTPDERLRTLYYQGRIYQNAELNDDAILCFLKARDIKNITDSLVLARLYVSLGAMDRLQYKDVGLLWHNLEAANIYLRHENPYNCFICYVRALNASTILEQKQRADSILQLMVDLAEKEPTCVIDDYSSVVLVYYSVFSNPSELEKIVSQYRVEDDVENPVRLVLADSYVTLGNGREALKWMNSAVPGNNSADSLKYYAVKLGVLESVGDYKGALEAYKQYSGFLEAKHEKLFTHDLLFAQERHDLEMDSMRKINRRNRIIWIALCALLAAVGFAVWLTYRHRLNQARLEAETSTNRRLEMEKANAELERDRQALLIESMNLQLRNLEAERYRLNDLLEEQQQLGATLKGIIHERINMLNALLAKEISNNAAYAKPYNEWVESIKKDKEKFMASAREGFRATNPRFIAYLEEHGLSDYEVGYLCLYVLGLRGKEIGEYIQLRRHYVISYNIRRKLGLEEHDTNIALFVKNLYNSFL